MHRLNPDSDHLELAIERAIEFIESQQLGTGAWIADEYFEPRSSSVHLVTLAFIGRMPRVEAREYGRFLCTEQRDDGGFPPYPFADRSDLSATALAYAALMVADVEDQRENRRRALAYIEANGGLDAVVQLLVERGDLAALYLAMAGLVDPFALPDPDLSFMVVPGALKLILDKINAGVVQVMIFISAVTRYLRNAVRPPGLLVHEKQALEAARAIDFYEGWLNPNGNNNGNTNQTDQAIATLFALGRSPEYPTVYSALSWFDKHKEWDERGLHLRAFFNHNWVTCLCLRALLFAGVSREARSVKDGLEYLCWSQSKLPMPQLNLNRPNAHLVGGWGFEDDNLVLPDTDDTGAVLGALGIAVRHERSVELGADLCARVQGAIDLGLPNLLDMQSDNGGWAGFVYNLGDKPAGPIFHQPIEIPKTAAEKLAMFVNPPVELGEPAVAGLTGRVLQGLGALGYDSTTDVVQRAVMFLERQQTESGAWWGRWFVAYLPATACAISGLADCGWNLQEPWIQKAITWLLSKQNEDGGWGEMPEAYDDPAKIGVGPSMPPLTGHVLIALIDAGLAEHPAVERGIQYLVANQEADGRWPSNGWLQVYEPNSTYYFYEGAAWYAPLEALAKYRLALRGEGRRHLAAVREPAPSASGSPRDIGDPDADAVIEALHASSGLSTFHHAAANVGTLGSPLPANLPDAAREFFETTAVLPDWADLALVQQGQRLFVRHSWSMCAGLLCSALPQSYAAAHGARVLTQSGGMSKDVHKRILNTAQFLFDCCDIDGLGPNGRGVRSAQKVRLTHAAVRTGILGKGGWDSAAWGVPINQEDLLGTALAFSVVLLDGLERVGITVDPGDQEAYFHLWMVVASLLGLHPSLRPKSVTEGRRAMQRIRSTQWAPSPQGKLLAEQLVGCMRFYFPGQQHAFPRALIRFFTGDACADLLGLERSPRTTKVLETAAATRVLPSVFEPLVQAYAGNLTKVAIDVQRRGKPARFRLPLNLFR